MQKIGIIIFLCLLTTMGWAQKKLVTGRVYDDEGPVPGASVIVKGSENTQLVGTITDFDGNFSIRVDINDVLVVSFIGYITQEVTVGEVMSLNIELKSETTQLEDVVVVGYGAQKKASMVGAISQAKGEELLKAGSVNTVTEALQGMLPGVTSVSSGTGKPGADAGNIIIRGVATWTGSDVYSGNAPLVLVDGVERDMNDLDPNEIESVSVLKDASATAVFGVLGANGVILITTKRGTISKPKVGFSANFGLKQPTASPEYADYITSMEMWNEAVANDQLWDELIPEYKINAWKNAYATGNYGPDNDYFPEVDWWDEIMKKVGYQQQYNVNVRGGTNFMKYFASLGYLHDGDVYNGQENADFDPSFNYKRYNWRLNLDLNLTKTTVFSANMAGKLGYRHQPGYRIDGTTEDGYGQEQFFNALYTASRNQYPAVWSNGTYAANQGGGGNPLVALNTGGEREYKYFQGFLDFKLNQKLDFITKGLSAKASFSYTSNSNWESYITAGGWAFSSNAILYSRSYDYAHPNEDGTLPLILESRWPDAEATLGPVAATYDKFKSYNKKTYYELAFNYARTFGDHKVTGLALFSRRERKPGSYEVQFRQEDWVGRVTYGYKDRYLLEANGSYNGSEAFAPGLRFGLFYSGSLGWRISEEPLVKEMAGNWLDNLKVRYSYGTSGLDGSQRFLYLQDYSTASSNNFWRGGVFFGDTQTSVQSPLYREGDAANDLATWETSIKQNLGVEFGVFNKLNGTLDVYNEKREDILMDVWAPLWYLPTGSVATGNMGETKNQGLEVELKWNDKLSENLRYWVSGNASFTENRIVYRNDGVNTADHLRQAGKPINWTSTYINNGYYSSLDDIYNYATANSEAEQSKLVAGDQLYVDYNGDGVITADDKVVNEDLKYPLNTYTLSGGLSYKGWALSLRFYGVSKVNKLVPDYILYDNLSGDAGIYSAGPNVTGRWTVDNQTNAVKPALHTSQYNGYSQKESTYSYRDASYWRLKNVEVSYSFSKKALEKYKMSKLQLYINGNNLMTFTDLDKRLDPEATTLSVFPMVKRYNIGLRASF
ncbi:SusC/RagA family TonB-linked outer membrane protein [Saccharicrinis fermentans]|uniref:TonB-linked outer membrane protein, SusC/RagA family n=1 Tax=Saccharicrinis fermentans DSM 9555 = JCM 21142 TaxID=869213 RepID=W7YK83_9BACT|nr:TonB-dependent receptor [Saccharicrinis fermentans]GAF02754.1 TonB-linked outer membrane protein, SusC/RagA family [Saccharicrinis fermentans DSM 9555 = JCM 21142]